MKRALIAASVYSLALMILGFALGSGPIKSTFEV